MLEVETWRIVTFKGHAGSPEDPTLAAALKQRCVGSRDQCVVLVNLLDSCNSL